MAAPEPDPLAWTDELVARFWSYYAERRPEDYFTCKFGDRILEVTEPFFARDAVVCDFGCGAGYLIQKLLPRYRAAGYDYAPANVEAARQRLGPHANLVGVFRLDEATPERQYDVVYCVETVEHLLEPQVAPTLARLRSLLKDDGRVIVTTPHAEDLDASTVFCPSCRHSFHRWQHVRSFDADRLTRFMAGGGFEPVAVFTTDFSLRSLLGRLRLRLRSALKRKHPHLVWIGRKGRGSNGLER